MASADHIDAAGGRARTRRLSDARSELWRAAPSLVAGLVAAAVLLALAWRQGGYFQDAYALGGAAAFAGLAVVLIWRPPYYRLSAPAMIAIASLCGLAAWTGLSSRWSSAPDVALGEFQRDLLYVGLLGLATLAAGSGRYSRHVLWGAFAIVVVIVGAGLVSRLRPDILDPRTAETPFGAWRLSYPVGYWNVFGGMGAVGVVLGTGLAADPRSHVVLRALAAAAVVMLGTAAYLSLSRGSWLAFFAGAAVLIVVTPRRASLLLTGAICGVALSATIGRLAAYDAITDGPARGAGIRVEGAAYLNQLIGVLALVAIAQVMASGRWLPRDFRELLVRRARPLAIGFAVLAVVLAAGVYVVKAEQVEGQSAGALDRAGNWVSERWDEFMHPTVIGTRGAERLKTARGSRQDLYRVAFDGFEAHPLWGDGAGGFEYRFAHDRDVDEKVRDAHSLYFETIGELGLVGALLLLAFLGAVVWAAVVARTRGGALAGAQAATAAAGFATWMVHAGLDWDWQMPAFTGIALLLAAALFPRGRGKRPRRRSL